jgi:hypothetical protein
VHRLTAARKVNYGKPGIEQCRETMICPRTLGIAAAVANSVEYRIVHSVQAPDIRTNISSYATHRT